MKQKLKRIHGKTIKEAEYFNGGAGTDDYRGLTLYFTDDTFFCLDVGVATKSILRGRMYLDDESWRNAKAYETRPLKRYGER